MSDSRRLGQQFELLNKFSFFLNSATIITYHGHKSFPLRQELYAKVLTEERNTLNWITGPGRQLITDVRKYTFIEGQTADNQSAASTRQELKVEKEADAFAGAMLKTEKKRLTKVKGLLVSHIVCWLAEQRLFYLMIRHNMILDHVTTL